MSGATRHTVAQRFSRPLVLAALAELCLIGAILLTHQHLTTTAALCSMLLLWHLYLIVATNKIGRRSMKATALLLTSPLPTYAALTLVPNSATVAIATPLSGVAATLACWLSTRGAKQSSSPRAAELVVLGAALALGYLCAPAPRYVYQQVASDSWDTDTSNTGGIPANLSIGETASDRPGLRLSTKKFKGDNSIQLFLRLSETTPMPPRLPIYLRERAFEQLEGNRWKEVQSPKIRIARPSGILAGWTPTVDNPKPNGPIASSRSRYTIFDPSRSRRNLLGMPTVNAIRLPGIVDTGSSLQFYKRPPIPIRYQVESAPIRFADVTGKRLAVASGPPHQLAVPANPLLRAALREIALQASPSNENAPPNLVLRKTAGIFANAFTYNESNAHLDNGDPLLDFVTQSRTGNCTMYASAMTLALRTMGYPARVAVGYTTQRYHPDPEAFVVRSRDAHAWPEVHLQDYGWVAIDPLNQSSAQNRPQDFMGTVPDFDDAAFQNLSNDTDELTAAALTAQNTSLDLTPAIQIQLDPKLAFFIAICILLSPFTLLRASRRIQRYRQPTTTETAAVTFLEQVYKHLHRSGIRHRKCETLQEYVARLKKNSLATDELDVAVTYYYNIRYRSHSPNRQKEDAILLQLSQWQPQMGERPLPQ